MKLGVRIIFALVIIGGLAWFFFNKSQDKNSAVSEVVTTQQVDMNAAGAVQEEAVNYEIIPREELYNTKDPVAVEMLTELKSRYKDNFLKFVSEVKSTNAKMVFCWLTTEVGNAETIIQREGKKFIIQLCKENNVEFLDCSNLFIGHKPEELTYYPVDGHLNKEGARVVAEAMAKQIDKFSSAKSDKTYTDAERPSTFGDFEPNLNEVRDGGKNLPYRLKINSQGLRMDYDLKFPKKKQRVLLIGDSGFFFPFLDNEKTGTGILQARYADKEIINAANYGFSIDDYLTIWTEKVKYTEPDIILLQSTGDDIADQYFTHRMRYSRNKDKVQPTELEKKFYTVLEQNAANNTK
jgi:hypothetical protein